MMWKDKYKIGVPLIDQQHEELFKRVSDFIKTVRQEGIWETKLAKVKENMAFMQEYVVVHFADEEAIKKKSSILIWRTISRFMLNLKMQLMAMC
ncbi:hypothetical protein N752_27290 [Desulforamulus aquiferis]|nr:hypothetical protein N752_27290 [Desulforamulus aquiferis]